MSEGSDEGGGAVGGVEDDEGGKRMPRYERSLGNFGKYVVEDLEQGFDVDDETGLPKPFPTGTKRDPFAAEHGSSLSRSSRALNSILIRPRAIYFSRVRFPMRSDRHIWNVSKTAVFSLNSVISRNQLQQFFARITRYKYRTIFSRALSNSIV